MHDPMAVAFEIKYPWREKVSPAMARIYPNGYRDTFITIWHRDPEKGGSDDSCDWFGKRRPLNAKERALYEAIDNLRHRLGNAPYYPDGPGLYGADYLSVEQDENSDIGLVGELDRALYRWRQRSKWRLPVRWHFWHWSFQVHPLGAFKRWAFTRCAVCGGRFKWNETGLGTWGGEGPNWFSSENLIHMNGVCDSLGVHGALEPQNLPGAPA